MLELEVRISTVGVLQYCAVSSAGREHEPSKLGVVGSNPTRRTNLQDQPSGFLVNTDQMLDKGREYYLPVS